MTFLQFLGYLTIVATILLVVRVFWVEIAVIGFILYVVGNLLVFSLVSAILWAVFVTGSAVGWGWTFLFFFLSYSAALAVYAMIVNDIFHMIGNALIAFFKKLK